MASSRDSEGGEATFPRPGLVNNVCRQWAVHEDGVVAYQMQQEENVTHFSRNRETRRTVRNDVIDARIAQHEEELREQEEAMKRLEDRKRLSEEQVDPNQIAETDEEIARRLLNEMEKEDELKQKTETEDERIAREMQEKENRKYERYQEKKKERELLRERKRLENAIAKEQDEIKRLSGACGGSGDGSESGTIDAFDDVGATNHASRPTDLSLDLSSRNRDRRPFDEHDGMDAHYKRSRNMRLRDDDGRVEDIGDFTDFYLPPPEELDEEEIRAFQQQQDEELARLLQEQEAKRGGHLRKDKMRTIEAHDADLARVIHEQEKLKLKRIKNKMKAMSMENKNKEPDTTSAQIPPQPHRSLSMPESTQGENLYDSLKLRDDVSNPVRSRDEEEEPLTVRLPPRSMDRTHNEKEGQRNVPLNPYIPKHDKLEMEPNKDQRNVPLNPYYPKHDRLEGGLSPSGSSNPRLANPRTSPNVLPKTAQANNSSFAPNSAQRAQPMTDTSQRSMQPKTVMSPTMGTQNRGQSPVSGTQRQIPPQTVESPPPGYHSEPPRFKPPPPQTLNSNMAPHAVRAPLPSYQEASRRQEMLHQRQRESRQMSADPISPIRNSDRGLHHERNVSDDRGPVVRTDDRGSLIRGSYESDTDNRKYLAQTPSAVRPASEIIPPQNMPNITDRRRSERTRRVSPVVSPQNGLQGAPMPGHGAPPLPQRPIPPDTLTNYIYEQDRVPATHDDVRYRRRSSDSPRSPASSETSMSPMSPMQRLPAMDNSMPLHRHQNGIDEENCNIPNSSSGTFNIATMIDPTYQRRSQHLHNLGEVLDEYEEPLPAYRTGLNMRRGGPENAEYGDEYDQEDEDLEYPQFSAIQGQKRVTLERAQRNSKLRDSKKQQSCKQQ